jgi:hypothetical protein
MKLKVLFEIFDEPAFSRPRAARSVRPYIDAIESAADMIVGMMNRAGVGPDAWGVSDFNYRVGRYKRMMEDKSNLPYGITNTWGLLYHDILWMNGYDLIEDTLREKFDDSDYDNPRESLDRQLRVYRNELGKNLKKFRYDPGHQGYIREIALSFRDGLEKDSDFDFDISEATTGRVTLDDAVELIKNAVHRDE